jgi:LmbE family N-acetylglucosaminyl deacetylase
MSVFGLARKSMLVVAPHADDEVLGAGGLILRAADEGWDVDVLFMTIAGFASPASGKTSTHAGRGAEMARAATILGLRGTDCLFPDAQHHLKLDMVAQADLARFVEDGIARVRPSVLVVPCRGHYHQDHRATAAACIAAARPAPACARPFVPIVLAYGHSAAGYGGPGYEFAADTFVDITPVIGRKLEALACYESQLCPPPHPRTLDGVRQHAAAWGAFSGTEYAEPYECIRHVI